MMLHRTELIIEVSSKRTLDSTTDLNVVLHRKEKWLHFSDSEFLPFESFLFTHIQLISCVKISWAFLHFLWNSAFFHNSIWLWSELRTSNELRSRQLSSYKKVFCHFQRRRFLLRLANNLPSESPLSKEWPACHRFQRETNTLLRKLYHRWRVRTFEPHIFPGTSLCWRDLFRGRRPLTSIWRPPTCLPSQCLAPYTAHYYK